MLCRYCLLLLLPLAIASQAIAAPPGGPVLLRNVVTIDLADDREPARILANAIVAAGAPVTTTLVAHHNLYRVASEGRAFL